MTGDLQTRADRRFRVVMLVFGLLTLVALLAGVLAAGIGREPKNWLIVLAVLLGVIGICGLGITLMVRATRRRAGSLVSPLWGADRETRAEVARILKNQEEPAGEPGRLALSEAERTLKMTPIALPLLAAAAVLPLIGGILYVVWEDELSLPRVLLYGFQALCFGSLAATQYTGRRRARAYLSRFKPGEYA
ncbi:hypothetical protein OHA21_01345 [Actinoplanes sp. NBC_00393]|uniref:hypothetical protein n=1 Tax=Actinoplanes sp. NBC_00393 TaxID=2975953 RepID=UPI002E1FC297